MIDGNVCFVCFFFLSKIRKIRFSVLKLFKYGKMVIENIGGMNMVILKY